MGMDLAPRTHTLGWRHLNWTTWGIITDLLHQCGADMTAASGTNDGDYVNADTARQWGCALLANIDRTLLARHPDTTYAGGWADRYVVNTTNDSFDTARARYRKHRPDGELLALNVDDRRIILSVAAWFLQSGGFRQY